MTRGTKKLCLPLRMEYGHPLCKWHSQIMCLSLGLFPGRGSFGNRRGMLEGQPCCLTISGHAHGETLFEATLLAAVAIDADDGAALVFQTPFVLDVLLDAPAEKALDGRGSE